MIRRASLVPVIILALATQAAPASTSAQTNGALRPAEPLPLPAMSRVDITAYQLIAIADSLLGKHCEIETEIRRAVIPEDERETLLVRSVVMGDVLEGYRAMLYVDPDPYSILRSTIIAPAFSVRLKALLTELTLVRLRQLIAFDVLRAEKLRDATLREEFLELLPVLDTRLCDLRPAIDEVETRDALLTLVQSFTPLLDETILLSERLDRVIAASPDAWDSVVSP